MRRPHGLLLSALILSFAAPLTPVLAEGESARYVPTYDREDNTLLVVDQVSGKVIAYRLAADGLALLNVRDLYTDVNGPRATRPSSSSSRSISNVSETDLPFPVRTAAAP